MTSAFLPRTLINGGMLRQTAGKTVSLLLCVENETDNVITGKSTDDQDVRVSLSEPLGARKGNWVEIIGTPAGNNGIRAKEAILFSGENIDFDKEAYNMMVLFMSNCSEIFRKG